MNLQDTFKTAIPTLEEQYKDQVRFHYENIKREYGETFVGVYNSWKYALTFRSLIEKNTKRETRGVGIPTPPRIVIDEMKLSENARNYALSIVQEADQKIHAKVGELTAVLGSVNSAGSGVCFSVSGYRGDQYVHVDQSMIMNVSKRGKVFNQWPALIRLNGKRISEKDFKKL